MKTYTIDEVMEIITKKIDLYNGSSLSNKLKDQLHFFKCGREGKIPSTWEGFVPQPTPEEIETDKKMKEHPLQFKPCKCGCNYYRGTSKGLIYCLYLSHSLFHSSRYAVGLTVSQHDHFHDQHLIKHINTKGYSTFDEAVQAAQAHYDNVP